MQSCLYFTGHSTLPAGKTLVLPATNLSNRSANRYVEVVFGYDQPSQLASWRRALYFNTGAIGQRLRAQLMAVDLSAAISAHRSGDDAAQNALATKGQVLASIDVTRVAGEVSPACPGP